MKKLSSLIAMAAVAASAHAQVTFNGGTDVTSISGYNPNGPAASLVAPGGKDNATISTTGGLLTATFLGFEAIDSSTFSFGTAGSLSNLGPLGATISGLVSAGSLGFTFADLAMLTSVGNGGNPGSAFTSYAVLGSFAGTVFTPFTLGSLYDVIIAFNDGLRVDADYDDMVVGLKLPVPEPERLMLMLAGLGALAYVVRRRGRRGLPGA
jgi:PEP-CTERM motif